MKIAKLYELEKYRARAAKIEREWNEQKQALLALPKRHGFKSVRELIEALNLAAKDSGAPRGGSGKKPRKSRAQITDEVKQAVKKAVQGGATGAQIAADLGLSPSSVQNIKTQLGLAKKRK